MMPSDVRLKNITIEAFRGFRDRVELDLNASTVILSGPNGTGKTSVFDAVQWVLVGSIERLEELRSRKNVEHVVSRYRLGEQADVCLVLNVFGREVACRRRGNYNESTLEVAGVGASPLFAEAAEEWLQETLVPHRPGALNTALSTCGLLQQDVMRAVLEAKPAERYAHISTVLGLGDLADFEHEARESAKRAQERQKAAEEDVRRIQAAADSARAHVDSLEQKAQRRASVDAAREKLRTALQAVPPHVVVDSLESLGAREAIQIAQGAREMARRAGHLADTAAELDRSRNALPEEPSQGLLADLRHMAEDAEHGLLEAEAEHGRAMEVLRAAEDASEQMARLAAAAIPLLGDKCPVCRQAIDPTEVQEHLQATASEASTLVALTRAAESAQEWLEAARDRQSAIHSEIAAAEAAVAAWRDQRVGESELDSALEAIVAEPTGPIRLVQLSRTGVEEQGSTVAAYLNDLASLLDRYGDSVKEAESTGDLDRARSELASAQRTAEESEERLSSLAARSATLKELAEASTLSRVEVTAARFRAIEPLVTDIYSRLDPHPAFKVIGFEHDTYYGKGTSNPVVRDAVADVSADPLIVFSASQANIAALSYFLAMSLGAGNRSLPFVLLDDPLQSMDDVNVLGFADLSRHIRNERQLMLSTHDRRFANLLRRKLAPRRIADRTIVHRFTGWDRGGPTLESEVLTYEAAHAELRVLQSVG